MNPYLSSEQSEILIRIDNGECLDHCDRIVTLCANKLDKGWKLCQGMTIIDKHCWLEYKTPKEVLVYDLTRFFAFGTNKRQYYKLMKATNIKRYTPIQIAMLIKQDGMAMFWHL